MVNPAGTGMSRTPFQRVGTFSADQILVALLPIGLAVAEKVYPFCAHEFILLRLCDCYVFPFRAQHQNYYSGLSHNILPLWD